MTMQCDPAKLGVLGGPTDLIEHFHLPQCHFPEVVLSKPDLVEYIRSLNVAEAAEFVRLSKVMIRKFEGQNLNRLRKLVEAVHPSEMFFITDARNQWLRTTISGTCNPFGGFSKASTNGIDLDIRSNVLPYDSYWKRPLVDEPSRRNFPCHILKDADDQGQAYRKLIDWKGPQHDECDISKHEEDDQRGPSKVIWDVDGEWTTNKVICNDVTRGTWKGGTFIKKDARDREVFEAERKAMEKLCHPHIVYFFGIDVPSHNEQGSFYMEWMDTDLRALIVKKRRRPVGFGKRPPFTHYDSVDILLQIAKAMAHVHQNDLIHGDLKSQNVLVSEFKISKNQYRYLAKVADFGSSKMKDSTGFCPAQGTTLYAAPEVLKFRDPNDADKGKEILFPPEYIDIYSFGAVAFEVLTGTTMEEISKTVPHFKKSVMSGTWKPPLREYCSKDKFLHNSSLMSLIERCWDTGPPEGPPQRPLFLQILRDLNVVRDQLLEDSREMLQQEDAHEALQEEEASEVGHLENGLAVAPAPSQDAPEVAEESAPEVEPRPTHNIQEDSREMLQQEDAHEELQEEDASEVLHLENGLEIAPAPGQDAPKVAEESAPEVEPRPTHNIEEANPPRGQLKHRSKYLKKLIFIFSCASVGNVQD